VATSQAQALITSQQLARLRLHRFFSDPLGKPLSEMQGGMVRESSVGQPTDTKEMPADTLAWALANTAQCCAYLAASLQCMAEKCANMQIESQESTYKRLLDSIGMLRGLLDAMRRRLDEESSKGHGIGLPVLSDHLAEEIRSLLARDQAITMGVYMTSIKSRKTTDTPGAGDTK